MRQLVFFILLGASSLQIFAQSSQIQGIVIDKISNKPIQGAAIQDASNMTNGTLSDSAGRFSLNLVSKKTHLIVGHISYETINVYLDFSETNNIVIRLTELSDQLEQVVISGNKTEKRLKELTMSLEILSPVLVQDKNPVVMDEIINQIPGVSVTDDQVSIRAASGWSYGAGSRVTVLADGAPIMNGDAGNVLWTFISQDHLASIEVLKGASSVLYGSSALNGIINITTLWPGEQPKSSFTLYGGPYSKAKRSGLHWTNDPLISAGLRFSGSRRYGKHDLNTNFEYVTDDGYRFGDFERRLHTGVDWRYALKTDMYVGIRAHYLTTETGSFLLWKSFDSAYNALDDKATITLGAKFRIDPFWVYRTQKNWLHKLNTRYLGVINNVDSGNPNVDQSNSSNTIYADYQATTPKKSGFQAIAGVLYTATKSKSPLFGGNQKSSNAAMYTQVEFERGRFIMNAGARLEHYRLNEYIETKPVFRSGLNYKLAKATYMRASYGQGYRFPTIAESFIETKVGVVSVFPNNQLKSETGWNAEIGVKQGLKSKFFKGFVDVALFEMRFNNMMEFTFSQWSKDVSIGNGLGLGFKSINTGKTEIKGIDLSVSGEFSFRKLHKIKVLAGYTFSSPQNLEPTKQIAIDSVGNALSYLNTSSDTTGYGLKYRNRHLVKVDLAYQWKSWDVGLSYRYNSFAQNIDKKFVEMPLSLFIPGIEAGQKLNENGTQMVDARIFYTFQSKYRVGLVMSNLFNVEFMERPGDMGPPRLILLQLRAQLSR